MSQVSNLLIFGESALDRLRLMPSESVHCIITSPPYWGLRNYGTEPQVWPDGWRGELGLEPTPELYVQHLTLIFRECRRVLRNDGTLWLNLGDSYCAGSRNSQKEQTIAGKLRDEPLSFRCQAQGDLKNKDLVGIPWLTAFALRQDGWYLRQEIIWHKPNPMPESVTDRCTKSHESIFLFSKSGTSQYWTHRDGKGARQDPEPDYRYQHITGYETAQEPPDWRTSRIPCPLCNGTGQRVIPLEDGLFGSETISVECDKCDEKTHTVEEWSRINLWQGHDYFFDHLAIAEPPTRPEEADRKTPARFGGADKFEESFKQSRLHSGNEYTGTATGTRNRRSVWTIATVPYPEAHYAVFPPELPRLCILAGTSAHGCCPHCSAPWERIIEKGLTEHDGDSDTTYATGSTANRLAKLRQAARERGEEYANAARTLGWQPTCSCSPPVHGGTKGGSSSAEQGQSSPPCRNREGSAEQGQSSPPCRNPIPCTVLDPFAGSGTTLAVAAELGRHYIGIELDQKNRRLCELRLARADRTANLNL